jgi:folate-dependent phosphoribosylglycinamide formyltransferase PurN
MTQPNLLTKHSLRIVIFSGSDAAHILRLITRIHSEVPEARVCGVLCERRPGKPLSRRISTFLGNLQSVDFIQYAISKIIHRLLDKLSAAGTAMLRIIHATPVPIRAEQDPIEAIRGIGCEFRVTTDYHSGESLEFVRGLQPDLGIVYGTRILKTCLFSIPRQGSINIHKRRVPDYRGGGPVGLWELLEGQTEIGVTVHQVTDTLDAGAIVNSACIPIEAFDNLTSLAFKAHVVANDLLVRSVADYARGTLNLQPQQGAGRMFKSPTPQQLAKYEKELARRRPHYVPVASRPGWKMALKSLIALPSVTVRNWQRRRNGRFPVTILFHHIVADRPHRLGVPTEHFLKHIRFLKQHYQIVSLREAVEMLKTNNVKRPAVVLTFDDGYRDNFLSLRAIVEQTAVPITMFVSTGHITNQNEFWHDGLFGIEGFQPLTWDQLQQMARDGFEIGSHTRTHFDCGSEDLVALQEEIVGSKQDLETRIGKYFTAGRRIGFNDVSLRFLGVRRGKPAGAWQRSKKSHAAGTSGQPLGPRASYARCARTGTACSKSGQFKTRRGCGVRETRGLGGLQIANCKFEVASQLCLHKESREASFDLKFAFCNLQFASPQSPWLVLSTLGYRGLTSESLDQFVHLVDIDRFDEMGAVTCGSGLLHIPFHAESRHGDRRNPGQSRDCTDLLHQLIPVEVGHLDIGDDHVRDFALRNFQCHHSIGRWINFVPGPFEFLLNQKTHVAGILDQ